MLKRLLIAAAILLALVLAVAASLPWWLGAALRGPAAERGLTFATYERLSYGRWALNDVVWSGPGLRVEVERITLPHPGTIWWRGAAAGSITVGAWRVQSTASAAAEKPIRPSWPDLLTRFDRVMAILPPVTVAAGAVELGNENAVRLASAEVDATGVRLAGVSFRGEAADLHFARADPVIRLEARERAVELRVSPAADGDAVELRGAWRGHPINGYVRFRSGEWVPEDASFSTGDWTLTGADLGLAELYEKVSGQATGSWQGGRFVIDLAANGVPVSGRDVPSLQVELRADGTRAEAVLQSLQVRLPGLTASLDQPMSFQPAGGLAGLRSRFQVDADLAALPWGELAGQVTGTLELTSHATGWPQVTGEVMIRELAAGTVTLTSATVAGELVWPVWRITALEAHDEAGSAVRLSGEGRGGDSLQLDLSIEQLNLVRPSLARWLPDALEFEAVSGRGTIGGAWPRLRANGEFKTGSVDWAGFQASAVRAELVSDGEGANSFTVVVEAAQESGRLEIQGNWRNERLRIEGAELRHDGTTLLKLSDPIEWAPGEAELARTKWAGSLGQWEVPVVSATKVELIGRGELLDLEWLRDWRTDLPPVLPRIESLDAKMDWTPGDLRVVLATRASIELPEVGLVQGRATVRTEPDGLVIEQFEIGKGDRNFAAVRGRLPLVWWRSENGWVQPDPQELLDLNVVLAPNPGFWRAWGELTGVTVVGPDVQLRLGGTWSRPTGEGEVRLKRLEVAERWGGVTWPVLTDLSGKVSANGEGIRIENLMAQIDGHAVKAAGNLPLTRADWRNLSNDPLGYLRSRGEARLEMPEAELASVARLLPDYLVPTGAVGVSLEFGRGGTMAGTVSLRGAVTKPIGPLGVLQEINADLSFAGREIRFESVRAMMGGQPLELDGAVDWPVDQAPRLDLHLQGSNVPLVRSTGMLLRGDLDLTLRTDRAGETTVAGRVGLRDGLMLADVRSLVPSGGERQSRRPPYFSVEVAPLRDWRLAVDVAGRRFLRMRTPILNGVASVEARLEGTLLNPRALGGVTLDEGVVKLPFANFAVEEAYARLTRSAPYQPEIFLRGEGRRLGYDLAMELSGTASDPRLEMSSSPALPADEVLLFVMAGVPPSASGTDVATGRRSLQLGVYLGRELVGDLLGLEPSDRLTVTTGEQVSRRGKETYRFDYELNRRWTLTGEYDEFDYYNAGLRWRWYPWSEDDAGAAEGAAEEQP